MLDILLNAFIVAFLWGLSSVLEKYYLLDKFTPYELMFLRSITTFVISLILIYSFQKDILTKAKTKIKNNSKSLLISFLILTIGSLGTLLFWKLIKKELISSSVSLITSLRVIIVVLIGCLIFKEKLRFTQYIGIILSVIGILLILNK